MTQRPQLDQPRRILSASVSSEEADRITRLAREADRSISGEIRRALREHIARESKEATP